MQLLGPAVHALRDHTFHALHATCCASATDQDRVVEVLQYQQLEQPETVSARERSPLRSAR